MFGLLTTIKECLLEISLKTIPTYLYHKGCNVLGVVRNWNQSHKPYQKLVPVFDILNAGPRNRFTVLGKRNLIVSNCQSTGHDLLVYWIKIYSKMLDDAGIEWHPIIVDFHDETIIEVEEAKAEQALTILNKAFVELNRLMNCSIPLTGEGIVCDNLADVKIEE